MGCFDYVNIPCPECGANIQDQSKAGPCNFENYSLSNMHPRVAAELKDEVLTCKCGAKVGFHVQFSVIPFAVEAEDQEDEDL